MNRTEIWIVTGSEGYVRVMEHEGDYDKDETIIHIKREKGDIGTTVEVIHADE